MGILRVLLATAVALSHYIALPQFSFPFQFFPSSTLSVEIFFIISGFYMALILDTKYTGPGRVKHFYQSRVLRLYPVYLLIVALFLIYNIILRITTGQWIFIAQIIHVFTVGTAAVKTWMIAANTFLFGQSAFFLFNIDPGTGKACIDCPNALPGIFGLTIPQAWSIEVEMLLYIFAPLFVAVRTKVLVPIVLILLAIKAYLYSFPGFPEFWNFRFPPSEAGLFLLGILSYRLYKHIKEKPFARSKLIKALCMLFFAALLLQRYLIRHEYNNIFFYIAAFFAIPLLFCLTKKNKFDREFGELSYLIYLIHMFPIGIFTFYTKRESQTPASLLILLAITFAISYLLHRFFQVPLDKYRHRLATGTKSPAQPAEPSLLNEQEGYPAIEQHPAGVGEVE